MSNLRVIGSYVIDFDKKDECKRGQKMLATHLIRLAVSSEAEEGPGTLDEAIIDLNPETLRKLGLEPPITVLASFIRPI